MTLRLKVLLTLFLLTALLSGCGEPERALQAKFLAFGTEVDVSLYGVSAEKAAETIEVLESSFAAVNNTWHAWRPSTLMDINEAIANGESIEVRDDVAELITKATQLANASEHLFNPAAGNLFALWGYHSDNWQESRPPPPQADIDVLLAAGPTMNDVQISDNVLRSDNSQVKIGFGGFAKGYAVDAAIEALQDMGIENAIVNMGGDLRAIGKHGERPWMIGIRHPRHSGVLASVAVMHNESVFSSGDYERFFVYEGRRYSHILDPRTGYPADQAMSATVLHNDALVADAAATALIVAGEDWPRIAAKMGLTHVMLMLANGELQMSPQMAKRARLIDTTATPLIREIED
ncbi:MAG: FAD:protein FMN transferase [Methylophaga sp.]|nr:FAD:protein FMN transferase [Methylophaga sp.]